LSLGLVFGLLRHVRNDCDVVVVNAELGKQGSHTEIEKRWDGNNIVTI